MHVRPDSRAARHASEAAERYAEALADVGEVLGLDEDHLPTMQVFVQAPSDPQGVPTPADEAGEADQGPGDLDIWTTFGDESADVNPELEVARAVVRHRYGSATAATRFWDEGLAGYLAARSRTAPTEQDAERRARNLLRDRALPPVAELVAMSTGHLSNVGSTAAASFAGFLVNRFGFQRYERMLAAAHEDRADPFAEVYPVPLAVAERDWRRQLEATMGESTAPWSTLRRLLPIARPYWPTGVAVLACSLVGVLFSLALPLSVRFLIDNILGRRPLAQTIPFVGPQGHMIAVGDEQIHALLLLLVLLGSLYLVNAASRLGMNLMLAVVGESFALDLRKRLVGVLDRLPASFYARTSPVDVSQRIVNDVETVQGIVTRAVVPLFSGAVSICCFTALLIVLEPKLALVALAGLPVVAFIHAARRRSRRAAARERARRLSELAAGVVEAASGHVVARLFLAGPYLAARLIRRMEIHQQLNRQFARESAFLGQVGSLVLGLIQVAVLMVGAYLIIVTDGRDLAPGSLVAFYLILNQLLGPIGQISTATQSVAGASASVERAVNLLEAPTEHDPPDAVEFGPLRDAIRFEGVSFAYPDGKPILKDLTLTIQAGTTAAFVGPSGAGKSSILHLLPRLYEPTHGSIQWDGQDLRSASLASLRRQIGLVPQTVALLNATVCENIQFGYEGSSDVDIREAARLAAADEEVERLPQRYDTLVGEGGVDLSAGQRQRIAVARAMLRRPSVLILDEATSALDATRQRTIQDRLRERAGEQTIVKVAHRLETVVDANVIFVLDDGRLVEQGTHAELLAHRGVYARLFADQTAPLRRARTATTHTSGTAVG